MRVGGEQPTADDFARAEVATVRVAPTAYAAAPAMIRAEFERRKCTIPQPDERAF